MFFITFEGIDQSGKSTQIELLEQALEKAGIAAISVREPGGTALGEQLRQLLLGPEHESMDAWTEALLYAAARAQLVKDVIRPALASGKIVLSDRYIDSSLAYQGIARDLGIERIMELNLGATGGLMPDLTIILHLDVDSSRSRLSDSGGVEDRIEGEPADFHQQVAAGYRELEQMYPARIVGLDGKGAAEDIHEQIASVCRERFELDL